ncbi:MAG: hypothetical protein Q8K45_21325 [Rubrivivax sp.]|nr:hypothetical protein [Rubrivivax sp.]
MPQIDVKFTPAAKPWWKSKTVWANALVLLLAAAETQLNVLQPLLPVNVYALVAFVLPVLNLWLRGVTALALSFKAPAPPSPEQTP